jgi:hypothetical protein
VNDWRFSCEFALKRAGEKDLGAVAAREGILGLPLSVSGKKAQRVYDTALMARTVRNNLSTRKNGKPLPEGSTGHRDIDKALAALARTHEGLAVVSR